MNAVEVETRRLGGAFGGKEEQAAGWAALAALGAWKTGKTVKVYLNRREDMSWTGKRHPYSSDYKLGLDAEGRILAFKADSTKTPAPAATSRRHPLAHSLPRREPYRVPVIRVTGLMCRTNLPPFTAFRGSGRPRASS